MVWITDFPDMTSAVYHGRKPINQTNKSVLLFTDVEVNPGKGGPGTEI